ncbi:MAG: ABC transporter ATP-binding protein [Sporomusa sp.]
MLEIVNVLKCYNSKPVVDNVSLNISKGRLTSFIGPNGAGKSTLLSIITQLIDRDQGTIRIDGVDIEAYDRKLLARKISLLKQSNNLSIRLTVRDLVGFGRFPYSRGRLTREDRQKVDEAISYLELNALAGKYLDQLSGGERQRAFIAMIMAQNTDYILLDEPLNNLDMKHSVQIMKVLRRMVDQLGKTVVLVLHDINFASCYSDEIVALKHGRLVRHGAVNDMIDSTILKQVYDMDIQVSNLQNQKFCIYYT